MEHLFSFLNSPQSWPRRAKHNAMTMYMSMRLPLYYIGSSYCSVLVLIEPNSLHQADLSLRELTSVR